MAESVAFSTVAAEIATGTDKQGVNIIGFLETVRKARGYLSLNHANQEAR